MDGLEITLQRFAAALSRLLDPAAEQLARLSLLARLQLGALGVPGQWQPPVLTGLWVLLLVLVVRALPDWWRLIAMVVAIVLLAKVYGVLPGA